MFKRISHIISSRFGQKDDLSRQLEIVKAFDIYRAELKKIFPQERGTRPVSLKNQVLVVQTTSSVMAAELRLRGGEIVNKINHRLGREAVKRVSYRF